MKGPFTIIYKDWFGFKHETTVYANNTDEALAKFDRAAEYDYEIVDCFMDWDKALFRKSFAYMN